jgi:beta-lactam-binding protein with PASTA domain
MAQTGLTLLASNDIRKLSHSMKAPKRLYTRHRKAFQVAFVVLCVFILFYFLLDRVFMPLYTRQGREFEMPTFVGLTIPEAQMVAKAAHLELIVEKEKFSQGVLQGTILEQLPRAGELYKTGRRVRVVPAGPPPEVTMPRLVGLELRDAQWRATSLGLLCPTDNLGYTFSPTIPKGSVVSQRPLPDMRVVKDDTVRLTISMGPEPERFIVPELVGQTLHEARKRIREAGLTLGTVTQKIIPRVDAGTIVAQSIRSGTEVTKGMRVDLVVAIPERE